MNWTIRPLLSGEFGMVRDDIKFRGGDPAVRGMVPSLAYLLENEAGHQTVVDTGFHSVTDTVAMGLVAKRNTPLPEMFAAAGLVLEKVEAVLLTHTHWDHAGNLGLFPGAEVVCQKADWIYAFSGTEAYPASVLDALRGAEPRTTLLRGDTEVRPGIRAMLMEGHIPGSQSFLVDTAEGPALICGDDIMTFRTMAENIPVGLCTDPVRAERALMVARESGAVWLLPSHDYQTLEYTRNKMRCRLE